MIKPSIIYFCCVATVRLDGLVNADWSLIDGVILHLPTGFAIWCVGKFLPYGIENLLFLQTFCSRTKVQKKWRSWGWNGGNVEIEEMGET